MANTAGQNLADGLPCEVGKLPRVDIIGQSEGGGEGNMLLSVGRTRILFRS